MRTATLAALAGLLALPALPAGAYGVSQVHFSIQANTPMPACHQRARDVLERSGFRILGTGTSSIGAEPTDGTTLITAYCVPGPGVVVVTVAGENTAATAPVLERIREAWQGASAPTAPGGPRVTK
ncbi:hypothetical protein [Plastoroseomonas arctica]|uniref:Uncharacterized protein n=1 Tax=Plastoroseomonas arctica TaxID=1509237 RepID=A0AAF1K1R1_9PROT|nr:hypothetical protein [Plastoroseomonas arctica]MBR0657503.1 hypothetical protein [Plastoroseomonas arctica]